MQLREGQLKAYVTSAPEDGKANRQLLDLVAHVCGVPKSQVDLRYGATSRTKTVFVPGLTPEQVIEAVNAACSE